MNNGSILTIFTIPKPFDGHIKIIQENSIKCWKFFNPDTRIILVGSESGVEKTAKKYCIDYYSQIQTNELGTPRLDTTFKSIQANISSQYVCYSNADILFLNNLSEILTKIPFKRFLLCGRRINLDIEKSINFNSELELIELKRVITEKGNYDSLSAIDFFLFPKNHYFRLPPFVVGRAGWDNWVIAYHKKGGIPIIDGTNCINAIHQNHDYSHIKMSSGQKYEGFESNSNRLLGSRRDLYYNLLDSDYIIKDNGFLEKRIIDNEIRRHKIKKSLYPMISTKILVILSHFLRKFFPK